jgi:hypothetical protein
LKKISSEGFEAGFITEIIRTDSENNLAKVAGLQPKI